MIGRKYHALAEATALVQLLLALSVAGCSSPPTSQVRDCSYGVCSAGASGQSGATSTGGESAGGTGGAGNAGAGAGGAGTAGVGGGGIGGGGTGAGTAGVGGGGVSGGGVSGAGAGTGAVGGGGKGGGGTGGGGGGGAGTSAGGTAAGAGGVPAHPTCPGDATTAYQGMPGMVPGTIEGENFDVNGYSDATEGNEGEAYRDDVDVDIKMLETGHAVGWMTAGEWLEYTVMVPLAGSYTLSMRAGSVDAGRTIEFSQCGTALTGPIEVPQISEWGDMGSRTGGSVQLDAGLQKIRVTVVENDYLDLDSFTLEESPSTAAGAQ